MDQMAPQNRPGLMEPGQFGGSRDGGEPGRCNPSGGNLRQHARHRRSAAGAWSTYAASWPTKCTAEPAWRRSRTWRTPTPQCGRWAPSPQSSAKRSSTEYSESTQRRRHPRRQRHRRQVPLHRHRRRPRPHGETLERGQRPRAGEPRAGDQCHASSSRKSRHHSHPSGSGRTPTERAIERAQGPFPAETRPIQGTSRQLISGGRRHSMQLGATAVFPSQRRTGKHTEHAPKI